MKTFTSLTRMASTPTTQQLRCVSQHLQSMHGHLLPPLQTIPLLPTTDATMISNNKRKRRPAGTPDPDADVVALSPKTLMESDRYVCDICNQGFQRDQNLQMHRRRHKVPWKLLKRSSPEIRKRVYVCPDPTCLHHNPSHALGDLVGIKKHYRRKHSSEKQWKCEKCSKGYAVQSDYKAHLKTCGTRGHCCDCGRVFSRVESFIEHQDTCSAAKHKATVGSSNHTSSASVSSKDCSPSGSADTVSVTTSSGVVTSGVIRAFDSVLGDNCLMEQQELQLLPPKPSCQLPHNLSLDRDSLGQFDVSDPQKQRTGMLVEPSPLMASKNCRFIRDETAPSLQLSIGLYYDPTERTSKGSDGLQICITPQARSSQRKIQESLSDTSMAETIQKSTETSSSDLDFILPSPIPIERVQGSSPMRGVSMQKKRMCEVKRTQWHEMIPNDQTRNATSLDLIAGRTSAAPSRTEHLASGERSINQCIPESFSTTHLELAGCDADISQLEVSQQGGLDIPSFHSGKQTENQYPRNSFPRFKSALSYAMDDLAAGLNRVVAKEIATFHDHACTRSTQEEIELDRVEPVKDVTRVQFLKQQAKEQLKIALAEKQYADQAREMIRKQVELAETELANAKKLREHAQAELATAQMLKEDATHRTDESLLDITCPACQQRFSYQIQNTSFAHCTEKHQARQLYPASTFERNGFDYRHQNFVHSSSRFQESRRQIDTSVGLEVQVVKDREMVQFGGCCHSDASDTSHHGFILNARSKQRTVPASEEAFSGSAIYGSTPILKLQLQQPQSQLELQKLSCRR